jgi:hypothetical protein
MLFDMFFGPVVDVRDDQKCGSAAALEKSLYKSHNIDIESIRGP